MAVATVDADVEPPLGPVTGSQMNSRHMHSQQESQNDDAGGPDNNQDEAAQYLLDSTDNLDQVEEYYCYYTHRVGSKDSNILLLDSCSTVNLVADKSILHGIHTVNRTMRVRCNA